MSQRYSYRNSPGDYKSHEDAFSDSYQRDSDIYRARDRSRSQESVHPTASSSGATDSNVLVPGKALSFLHSCGLDASDLSMLADLPEHLITVETLPQLLLQIKERKSSNTSSSRSSTTQPVTDTPSHAVASSSYGDVVEYPVDRSTRSTFPLPPEQVQTWQDRWGNPRKSGFVASTSDPPTSTSHQASNVREYGHSREGTLYYDEQPYTSATSQPSSTASHSYDEYNSGNTQNFEPLHHVSSDTVFKVPSWKEASAFNGILPTGFPYVCVLCKVTVHSEKDWSVHIRGSQHANSQRRLIKQFPKWNHSIDSATRNESSHQPRSKEDPGYNVPTRKEASDFYGKNPPVFPYPCVLCNVTASSKTEWTVHVKSVPHASSQLRLLEKYPRWDQSMESSRRNDEPVTTVTTETTEAKPFVKRDPVHKVPTIKEASNFRGRAPLVYPNSCVLCDFTVLSKKDWAVHVRSAQHANSQLELVEKYPEWDQQIISARKNESKMPAVNTTEKTEKPKKKPKKEDKSKPTVNSHGKVVTVKFGAKKVEEDYLIKLLGQFGKVVKVMMFSTLALVEMGSKEQSDDVVKYFTDNPLEVQEKAVEFSVSTAFSVLQHNRVVCFAPLPAGDGTSSELLAIAKRFGSVKSSSFLPTRGYVEMINVLDAQKLVDHYSDRPLKLKGTTIQITLSSEYETLDSVIDNAQSRSSPRRRSRHRDSPSPSPKRRRSSERTRSSEKSRSSRRSRSKERDRQRQSTHRSKTSSKKSSVSSGSSAKDESTKSSEDAKAKITVSSDDTAAIHSDSDVEGLEVIADDGEELQHDDHEPTDDEKMDQDQKTGEVAHLNNNPSISPAASSKQNSSGTTEEVKDSTSQRQKSDISVSSGSRKKDQASEGQACEAFAEDEEDPDFPYNLENCITLDELEEEASSDESGEQKSSVKKDPEGTLEEVTKTVNSPTHATLVDSEDSKQPESPKDKSISKTDAEIKSSEVMETVNLPSPTSIMDTEDSTQPESPKDKIIGTTAAEIKSLVVPETVDHATAASVMDSEDSKQQPASPEDKDICRTTAETKNSEDASVKDTADQSVGQQEGEKDTDEIKKTFGKVLHIRNLPKAEDYTDSDFMNLVKRYGELKHYYLIRNGNKGFVEMMQASDAERIAADAENQDVAFRGNVLKIKVSEKYSSLPATGFNVDYADSDEEEDGSETANTMESTDDHQGVTEAEAVTEPNKPNEPVGTEFVRPVVGYFCNLCNVIYASEEEAKDEHCRSQSHHEKVKEHKKNSGSA